MAPSQNLHTHARSLVVAGPHAVTHVVFTASVSMVATLLATTLRVLFGTTTNTDAGRLPEKLGRTRKLEAKMRTESFLRPGSMGVTWAKRDVSLLALA